MQKLVSYSIDVKVLAEFKELAKQNSINSSKFVENAMKKFIEECKEKNDSNSNELPKTL